MIERKEACKYTDAGTREITMICLGVCIHAVSLVLHWKGFCEGKAVD